MAPFTGVAALAADNDARTLRIPNRLVAAGASVVALTVAFTAIAFDAPIVWPSIVGAAIFAVPLFVSHALSHGGTGLGDVKLGAVLGLVAGAVSPSTAFGAVLVSMLLGSVFGLFWRRRRRGGSPLRPLWRWARRSCWPCGRYWKDPRHGDRPILRSAGATPACVRAEFDAAGGVQRRRRLVVLHGGPADGAVHADDRGISNLEFDFASNDLTARDH